MLLLSLLLACSEPRPEPVPAAEAQAIPLSVSLPFAELELPPSSRPEGRAPPERIPISGWKLVATTGDESERKTYEAVLPVRLRSLFFIRPPKGMVLVDADEQEIPHAKNASRRDPAKWTFTRETLSLTLPSEAEAPHDLALRYDRATQREARLNLQDSGLESEDFARATVLVGPTHYQGLLLPAPATASFDLTVPPAAELWLRPGLVAPETRDGPASDGARLVVELEAGGTVTPVWSTELQEERFDLQHLDLSAWSGQEVRLRLRTEPGADATFDYAFVADPVLASRKDHPQRLVWIFYDTLRVDHLPLYGYERDTAPSLDAFAAEAAVFDQARSVAPWTLPSTRTLVTGRQPEHYGQVPTLQGMLRQQGWATAFLAGNVYLSANFDMHEGWGQHTDVNWPLAEDQVDDALAWLDEHQGRDAFIVLHFMDSHLPYREPASYRRMYAGDRPENIQRTHFNRNNLYSARGGLHEEEQQYVRDRYDNTIRYTHDELGRLFSALGDEDVVFYFSDHGEEFWDHGGFEHGHTLFDELLHVPLVIRAPGVPAGRIAAPVSLLDLVPTSLDLLGLEAPPVDGTSLVGAMQGDATALKELADRPQAFGRPLYGNERWGVLAEGHKYTAHEGREALYDIVQDPGETDNAFVDAEGDLGATWRPWVTDALGREMVLAYRVYATRANRSPEHDTVAELHVPGGIRAAWAGNDYMRRSHAEVVVDGEVARVRWFDDTRYGLEFFVVPNLPPADVTHALSMDVRYGDESTTVQVKESRDAVPGKIRTPLARALMGGRQIALTWAMVPMPLEDAEELEAYDDEVSGELEALGYVEAEQPSTLAPMKKPPTK